MRLGQGQRRGGRRNEHRHGGGNGGSYRSSSQGQSAQGQQRSATSLRNQIFDSNGPDMRIRGNAFQVHEKYQTLAKDALSSGDRVLAENYLQHAEHYYRIIEAINEASAVEQLARQASWESQPQPQSTEGQPQGGAEQGEGGQPPQDGTSPDSQESQSQGQPQGQPYGNDRQRYRRREHSREHSRDNQRDNSRDNYRDRDRGDRYRDRDNRHQQRYGNPDNRGNESRGNESRGNENRGNEGRSNDMSGNRQGYDPQQRQAEFQPHHQTRQTGSSQDPLYDGVDEDVNDSPDTQAAVGGGRR